MRERKRVDSVGASVNLCRAFLLERKPIKHGLDHRSIWNNPV